MQTASRYLMLEQQQRIQRYGNLLAVWGAILGFIAVSAAVYVSFTCYLGVPFEDVWTVVEELGKQGGSYHLPVLWALHNEHRQPISKLLITADLYWFQGRNLSLYFEIYLVQILELLIFVWAMRKQALWPNWLVCVGCGLTAFALFWTSQFQSFINPLGVAILPAAAFGTVAFAAMVLAVEAPKRSLLWVLAAITAAFIVEASLANGLVLWPLMLIAAIRFRLPWRLTLTLAVASIVFTVMYLYGYQGPKNHASPADSLRQPALMTEYLLIYFGSLWGSLDQGLGLTIAAIGIPASVALYLRELIRPKPRLFGFALLSLCMFLFGTGFLTALGRINFPLEQAASSRYQTTSLLFWLCLCLFAIDAAYRLRFRYALLSAALSLMLFTAVLPSFPSTLKGAEETRSRIVAGALPLYADVKDDREIGNLMVLPAVVFQQRAFLMEHHTSIYADRRYGLLGKSLAATFQQTPPDRCFGTEDRDRRIASATFPGWKLEGWAWDHKAMKPVSLTIAVSHDGIISGIGMSGDPRPDVRTVFPEISDPNIGWRLYLQGAAPTEPEVKVYGVVNNGKAVCLITPPFSLPKTTAP